MKFNKATMDNKRSMFIQPLLVPKKQKGATLFTALVFLSLMTIVSVSATKISMLDILVSGNNQQSMMVYQKTDNVLQELTTPVKLLRALKSEGFESDWTLTLSPERRITNREVEYKCTAGGQATSIGDNIPPCFLFDFEAKQSIDKSGVRDRHTRGAGKEFPDLTPHNANPQT
jgi:hypothetical protein